MVGGITRSPEETLAWGMKWGQQLTAPVVVALYGELGAGKTTFAKGLVAGATGISPHEVTSPTFTYLQVYPGPLFHFDLYRITGSEAFLERGFEEHFEEGIVVIEWAERIERLLPADTLRITLLHRGEGEREIRHDPI